MKTRVSTVSLICMSAVLTLAACDADQKAINARAPVPKLQAHGDTLRTDSSVSEKTVGEIVAVDRRFKVEIKDCEKVFKVQRAGSTFYSSCDVELMQADPTETQAGMTEPGPLPSEGVNDGGMMASLSVKPNGYRFFVQGQAPESEQVTFDTVKPAIEKLMKDTVPSGELGLIVHTIRK